MPLDRALADGAVPRPIVIDTDPGQDDAIAILLALAVPDALRVETITTVAGNVSVAQTTSNALRVCELADRADVPVHAGAHAPLVMALETAEFVCGPDGLDGADLPAPSREAAAGHGVDALIDVLRRAPDAGVTLCALGPLTNLALAIRLAPDILPKIARIVLMGGAMGLGNMTPAAEFNIYVDPHAAAIVFGCGRPLVMMGLNVTHKAVASPAHVERIRDLGSATGRAVHGMLTRPRPGGLGTAGHPLHDPCVVAYVLWPELFSGRDCFVAVETGDGPLRGRTTVDWHGRLKRTANALVVDEVDAPALLDRLIATLVSLP